mmetsp:Transcript_5080/g.8325  ORF Transcript_5080/g.8325 Transcript_5080/m.8325 type:complete len:123 (-) Transcript_5080:97-465(-)
MNAFLKNSPQHRSSIHGNTKTTRAARCNEIGLQIQHLTEEQSSTMAHTSDVTYLYTLLYTITFVPPVTANFMAVVRGVMVVPGEAPREIFKPLQDRFDNHGLKVALKRIPKTLSTSAITTRL